MDATTHAVDSDVTAIYLDHLPSLERYAQSLTRDEEAAADICQEVFIRLLVIARSGRMPDVPAAWMHRVAHNLFISGARRKSTNERTLEALVESRHVTSTEDAAISHEREALVRDVLTNVRPFEREAMVLAAEGYGSAEIGDRLGRTATATRALLCRARGQLRMQLRDYEVA
jgi:RNA polymerase sigma-70 factor (ECF subfamily)